MNVPTCYQCGHDWTNDPYRKLYEVEAEGKKFQICSQCLGKMTVEELFFENEDIANATVTITEIDVASAYRG